MPSTNEQDAPPNLPPSKSAKKAGGKCSVDEHGDSRFPVAAKGPIVDGERRPHAKRWQHAAAAALHDWTLYAHHNAKPMQLSDEDYEKALEAACKPNKKGSYIPHKAAQYVASTPKA